MAVKPNILFAISIAGNIALLGLTAVLWQTRPPPTIEFTPAKVDPMPLPLPSTVPFILTVMSTDDTKREWRLDVVNVFSTRRMCDLAASAEALRALAPDRIVYWSCDDGEANEPLNTLRQVGGVMRSEEVDRAGTPFERVPPQQRRVDSLAAPPKGE